MAETLLEVRDLTVSFRTPRGRVRAVDAVSFSLAPREILCVVGESGSGKTLTALALMGLILDPNAEVSGSVRFEGRELVGLPQSRWCKLRGSRVAMIFQDPMTALTPVYTIGWQIAEQLRAHRALSRRAAASRAVELLAAVGIADPRGVAGRYPHLLSGGMRQRAVIAMALSCEPALLIADEPTTALDVSVQAQILLLLERLRTEFGSSILLITHDMGVVAETADRVLVMYAGRIAERGPIAPVFATPRHPYTIGLLRSIPPMEGARPARLAAIPGAPPTPTARPQGCGFRPRCGSAHDRCREQPPLIEAGGQEASCWLLAE